MVVKNGEKVFIVARRFFQEDLRRHFVGEVMESSATVARVRGYVFVFDNNLGDFVRREDVRTRIFTLTDAAYVINILPKEVIIESLYYKVEEGNQRVLTDGKTFRMNVSEFSSRL